MRKLASLSLAACAIAIVLGVAACDEDGPTDPELEQYVANLLGSNENPANTSTATGTVLLTINSDNTVTWTMDLTGIRNMTASHIHAPAGAGVNAGVVVNLLIPLRTVTETLNGRVASATFGPSAVASTISYADLLAAIRSGNAYVNVHTNDGVAPTNTGMGDFPGGEIRGQTLPAP